MCWLRKTKIRHLSGQTGDQENSDESMDSSNSDIEVRASEGPG